MSTSIETSLRISAGMDFVAAGNDEDVRGHYLWQVKQLMHALAPEDLSTPELVSLVAVLIPAHSRLLGGQPTGRDSATVLSIVRGDVAADGA